MKDFLKYKLFSKYWWKHVWYIQVSSRIRPRNKWAEKSIPRTFSDVDYIFEEILFNGLISFWEKDGGESSMRYQWDRELEEYDSPEHMEQMKEIYHTILAAYDWAKGRANEYDNFSYDFHKEQELIAKDSEHLSNIVKYRKWLWT